MKKISILFLVLILISNPPQVFAKTQSPTEAAKAAVKAAATKGIDTIKNISSSTQEEMQRAIGYGKEAINKGKAAIQKAQDAVAGVATKAQKIKAKYAEMEGLLTKTTATATKIKSLTNDIADFPSNSLKVIKSMEEECTAKLDRITQNTQTIANSDISNLTNSDNAAEMPTADIEKIQSACVDGTNKYVADRETELNNLLAKVEEQQEDLENLQEDYEKLYNEVTGKKGKEKKDKKENEEKLKKKNFLEVGTIDFIKKIEESRKKEEERIRDEITSGATKINIEIFDDERVVDSNAAIANTMEGMSESNIAITKAITAQTLMLKSYVDVMVMGLKLRLANNLAASKKYSISNPDRDRNIMDLANYMYPPPANLLEMAGEIAANAQGTVGKVTNVVAEAQSTVSDAKNVAQEAANTAQDAANTAQDVVGDTQDMEQGE